MELWVDLLEGMLISYSMTDEGATKDAECLEAAKAMQSRLRLYGRSQQIASGCEPKATVVGHAGIFACTF